MLTTTGFKNFGFEISDTTISVLPGTARVGDKLLEFDGTQVLFDNVTYFGAEINSYQNTLFYLNNVGDLADMSQVRSDVTSSYESLDIPALPDSSGYPLGLFTFYKDASDVSSYSYSHI
jgi:hypothetical protein